MRTRRDNVHLSQRTRFRTLLANLRRDNDLTQAQVAEMADLSVSTLIRMENGTSFVSIHVVRDLLRLFKVPEEEIESLLREAAAPRTATWLELARPVLLGQNPLVTKQFYEHLDAEATAFGIRQFRLDVIPTLLQSPDYTAALVTDLCKAQGRGRKTELGTAVSALTDLALSRQKIISPNGTRAEFLLDEFTLLRQIGTEATMRRAVKHLLDVAEYPTVSVRIVRRDAGGHIGLSGSYAILESEDGRSDTVTVAHPLSMVHCFTKGPIVVRYLRGFANLADHALTEAQTREFLQSLL